MTQFLVFLKIIRLFFILPKVEYTLKNIRIHLYLFANIVQGETEMNKNIVKSAYENIYLDYYCSIITIYIVVIAIELQNAVTTHFV